MGRRVRDAVTGLVPIDTPLATPTGRGSFTVARYTSDGLVLLLGEKQAWTPLPWAALDSVPDLLRGRGWVPIGGTYRTDATPGTLDAHLKTYLQRATGGWVAVVLETAGVVRIDRGRPASVRLTDEWT
jgi:hypothetical protein